MKECSFKTGEWIYITSRFDGETVRPLGEDMPLALQVWPVPEVAQQHPKAVLTASAFLNNSTLVQGQAYSLESFEHRGKFDYAASITVQIEEESLEYDSDRLISTFKTRFESRPVIVGNKFTLEFYASLISCRIHSITPPPPLKSVQGSFYQITNVTNLILEFIEDDRDSLLDDEDDHKQITMEDVGGLNAHANHIQDAVKYMLKSDSTGKIYFVSN